MIITKEHQEELVSNYIKEKHNQDECIGFIDGLNKALELVKNLTIPAVINQVCQHTNKSRLYCDKNCKECPDYK
jgi:hypothetical protein